MDDMNPIDGGNDGFLKRWMFFNAGSIVDLEGPLLSDMWQQPRAIVNGVELQVKMWPAKPQFAIMTNVENPDFRLEIVEAYLKLCKMTPVPAVMLAHAETMQKVPATYPYTRTDIKTFQLNQGQYSFNLEDLFQTDVPSRVVVGMVKATSFNGEYNTNPYNFEHFNLTSLGLFLDDQSVPAKPLKMNFEENNYMTAYNTLFTPYDEEGIGIQRTDFNAGYALFMFRMVPEHIPPHVPLTKGKANVRLSGSFAKPLSENVTLIIYAQFPSVMKIDSTRNVYI